MTNETKARHFETSAEELVLLQAEHNTRRGVGLSGLFDYKTASLPADELAVRRADLARHRVRHMGDPRPFAREYPEPLAGRCPVPGCRRAQRPDSRGPDGGGRCNVHRGEPLPSRRAGGMTVAEFGEGARRVAALGYSAADAMTPHRAALPGHLAMRYGVELDVARAALGQANDDPDHAEAILSAYAKTRLWPPSPDDVRRATCARWASDAARPGDRRRHARCGERDRALPLLARWRRAWPKLSAWFDEVVS